MLGTGVGQIWLTVFGGTRAIRNPGGGYWAPGVWGPGLFYGWRAVPENGPSSWYILQNGPGESFGRCVATKGFGCTDRAAGAVNLVRHVGFCAWGIPQGTRGGPSGVQGAPGLPGIPGMLFIK